MKQKVVLIPIPNQESFTLKLPITADVLSVQTTDRPVLVVLHPDLPPEEISIWKTLIFTTIPAWGSTENHLSVYAGSFQIIQSTKLVKLGGAPAAEPKPQIYSVFYTEIQTVMGAENGSNGN